MQSAKETASNIGASAKAGMEKTKAAMQEKAERMSTRDPLQKEMATDKKEQRMSEAERQKQDARMHNAATKQGASAGETFGQDYTTGGDYTTAAGTGLHPTTGGTTGTGLHQATGGGTGTGLHQATGGATGTGLHPSSGGGHTATDREFMEAGPEDPNIGRGTRGGYGSGDTY